MLSRLCIFRLFSSSSYCVSITCHTGKTSAMSLMHRKRERESIQSTYDISSNSVVLLNTLIHTHIRTHADNCQPGYQLEFLLLHNKTSQTDWCRLGGFTEEQGRDENNERMIASLSVFACILIFHLYLEYANTLFMSFCLKTWITLHSMEKKNTLARF